MLKSFVAGIGIILAGLFGSPHLQPVVPLHDQPAAATVALFPIEGVTPNLATTTQDSSFTNATTTIINNYITKPVVERVIERPTQDTSSVLTQSAFNQALQLLDNKFASQLASLSVSSFSPNSFLSVAAFAPSQRIDSLTNVTISNATVHGVSGLTAADIPVLSYLPLSGGVLTYASSTLFSAYNGAYFGATATSSFDSTGALSLATPLLVSSGGTGANTFGQGWLYSSGGSGVLAASTSPTVNYITATSTTRPNYFASFLDTSGTTGGYKIDGNLVLQASTTLFSTFVGRNAGNSSMTGINNTGLGDSALSSNTTGSWNSAFGFSALSANTTGSWNTAYGWSAILSNTTANANVGIGYYALRSNTTGSENTAVGSVALQFNTTGNYNEAVGYQALWQNTTGGQNAANGYQALIYNTTGSDNTGTGYSALWSNTTGSSNTGTGFQALAGC